MSVAAFRGPGAPGGSGLRQGTVKAIRATGAGRTPRDGDDAEVAIAAARASVHFAAGIAVCQAAGCTVTGIDGAPIGPAGRGLVVAADGETHELLMSMIHGL